MAWLSRLILYTAMLLVSAVLAILPTSLVGALVPLGFAELTVINKTHFEVSELRVSLCADHQSAAHLARGARVILRFRSSKECSYELIATLEDHSVIKGEVGYATDGLNFKDEVSLENGAVVAGPFTSEPDPNGNLKSGIIAGTYLVSLVAIFFMLKRILRFVAARLDRSRAREAE